MTAKIAYHILNGIASAASLIGALLLFVLFTPIYFCGWVLPRYYRALELRVVYKGDEAARSRDEFHN